MKEDIQLDQFVYIGKEPERKIPPQIDRPFEIRRTKLRYRYEVLSQYLGVLSENYPGDTSLKFMTMITDRKNGDRWARRSVSMSAAENVHEEANAFVRSLITSQANVSNT